MKTTLAIYGPWERISTDFHLYKAFTQYLQQARDIKQISKIIYVQTEAEHTIPTQYVDDVYFTDRTNIFDKHSENKSKLNFDYNLGFLGANIKSAHKNSETSHIICHRCDVIPRNLLNLIQIYETREKGKHFLIDYSLDHSCVIPFYLSDFFYMGPVLTIDLALLQENSTHHSDKRSWNITPFKFLTIGRIPKYYCYSEYAVWSFLYLKRRFRPLSMLSCKDFIDHLKFIKQVEFVSRSKNFINLGKIVGVNNNPVNRMNFKFFSAVHIILTVYFFIKKSACIIVGKIKK